MVSVDVLVTDKRTGARVEDLKRENFEVLDDGRPVSITHFSQGADPNRPLALILFVNVRHTTKAVVPRLREALRQALLRLQPEDEVAVFAFWRKGEMLQELTRDRTKILQALEKTVEVQREQDSKNGASSFDSIMSETFLAGLQHAQERRPQSRIALVGIDDDLNATPRAIVERTAETLVASGAQVSGLIKVSGAFATTMKHWKRAVDTAGLSAYRPGENLEYYSAQTGGEIVNVKGDDYSAALEQVIGNLVGRYSLGFVLEENRLDGKFHKLTVKVKLPNAEDKKQKILVRARKGYFARKEGK
ncbi:MAG: VWA domain-containing protein [Acidobacteriota bacterium]|nr:VWA domain-containing protein [Acidobacteriota bacterium]